MNDIPTRLKACFLAVFPDLPPEHVMQAAPQSIPGWDSLTLFTLMSVIEEEFGVDLASDSIPSEQINAFFSYDNLCAIITAKLSAK